MKKEFDILQKKIHLHENEIERIQGLSSKYALKKGKYEGELKRRKFKSIEQNQIIKQSRSKKPNKSEEMTNTPMGYTSGVSYNNDINIPSNRKTTKTFSVFTGYSEQKNQLVSNLKSMINTGNISRLNLLNTILLFILLDSISHKNLELICL